MAGPLDILRGLASGAGDGSAPRPSMPAFSAKDLKTLEGIEATVRNISAAARQGAENWEQLGDARALLPAKKALTELRQANDRFNAVMATGVATIEDQVDAYNDLAVARRKASQELNKAEREINESRGAMGRLKNVLDDVAEHKYAALLVSGAIAVKMAARDVNNQFDILARSGQLTQTSFTDVGKATLDMSLQMRLAMVQAGLLGISADESNKAFLRLTETFGGTSETARSLQDDWTAWSELARISGLSMTDVAALADQGYKRLGETIHETGSNIARMSDITQGLNARFGKGMVNTRDFAKAVQTLAYSQGFYNQNTRLVIESLGREISTQLALGKSREAAVAGATQNLQDAAKVNLVGFQMFARDIMEEWTSAEAESTEAGEAYLQQLTERFGSQGEVIASMLRRGENLAEGGIWAFKGLVGESQALGSHMMETLRLASVEGSGLLMGLGIPLERAEAMRAETASLIAQMQALAGSQSEADIKKLFKLKPGEAVTEGQRKFAQKLPGLSPKEMLRALRDMGGREAAAMDLTRTEGAMEAEWKGMVEGSGKGWFLGVTNLLGGIAGAIANLPSALAGVLGGLALRPLLGGLLGAGAGAGAGAAAAGAGGAGGAGLMAGAGRVAMTAGRAMPAIWLATQAHAWLEGIAKADEILGKDAMNVTNLEKAAAGAANAVSYMTFGLLDAQKIARAQYGFTPTEETLDALGLSGGDPTTRMYQAQSVRQAEMAAPSQGSENVPSRGAAAPAMRGAGGAARGAGYLGTGGKLILEVSNWEDIMAESQLNMAANQG